jgi:hypothetical protein
MAPCCSTCIRWRARSALSAGLVYNDNKLDATGRGDGGTIEINGISYPAADVGTLQAAVRWDKASPYVGFGWGTKPAGTAGLFLSADVGAFYMKPTASLTGTCGAALPTPGVRPAAGRHPRRGARLSRRSEQVQAVPGAQRRRRLSLLAPASLEQGGMRRVARAQLVGEWIIGEQREVGEVEARGDVQPTSE